MADVFIDEAPLCFLDCETTGLDPFHGDRICEIALVRVEKGITTKTFEALIDPQREISLGAFFINGIKPEMLYGKPQFIELVPEVLESIQGAVLVGHNVIFDINFLREELRRVGMNLKETLSVDTLKLARRKFSFPSFALSQLAQSLGVDIPKAGADESRRLHRAMSDVLVLRDVFERLIGELRQREGLLRMAELFKIAGIN